MKRICVIGNFSGRNAGDAAILGCLLADVDRRFGKTEPLYEIPTINPGFVASQYAAHRVRPVGLLPWNLSLKILGLPVFRSVLHADLVLVTDAILFDLKLYNPLFNYLWTMALVLPMAKRRGIPVVLYNASLGPVTSKAGRDCLRAVVNSAAAIIVRDAESVELLKGLGGAGPAPSLGADCALNTVPSDDARVDALAAGAGFRFGERGTVSFNVNSYLDVFVRGGGGQVDAGDFAAMIAGVADRVVEELGVRVLFVVTQPMDAALTRDVMRRLRHPSEASLATNRECTYKDLAAVFSRVQLHVGMRTHSLILASSVLTPAVGIMATPKNRGFMRSIGQEALALEMAGLTADRLFAAVSAAWRDREAIRGRLRPVIEREKAKARASVEALARYLERGAN